MDIKVFNAEALNALCATPVKLFRQGIHFVISEEAFAAHPEEILAILKWATHVYFKYFYFPSIAAEISDPAQRTQ